MRLLRALAVGMAFFVSEARADISIALLHSFTGPCAGSSDAVRSVIEKATADINARVTNPDRKVRFEFADAQCDPKWTRSHAERLLANNVDLVIWSPNVSARMRAAAGPLLVERKVMQISLSSGEAAPAHAAVQLWAKIVERAGRGASTARLAETLREIEVDTAIGRLRAPARPVADSAPTPLTVTLADGPVPVVRVGEPPRVAQNTNPGMPSTGRPGAGGASPPSLSIPPVSTSPPISITPSDGSPPVPAQRSSSTLPNMPRPMQQLLEGINADSRADIGQILNLLGGKPFIRQETPGTDVGGSAPTITPSSGSATGTTVAQSVTEPPATPAPSGVQGRALEGVTVPALPVPDVTSGICRFPPNASIGKDDEFLRTYLGQTDKRTGRSAIAFCREGFSDVVMIDDGAGAVCSGVVLPRGWILTARHCIGSQFAARGEVYRMRDEDVACLKRQAVAAAETHPGVTCKLGTMKVDRGRVATFAYGGRAVDIALIPLLDVALLAQRTADMKEVHAGPNPLLTFAGYGQSDVPDEKGPGILRVGWGLGTWDESLRSSVEIPVIGVAGTAVERVRNATVPCRGDSGGPAFLGRVFGYANERHELFGIVVKQTSGGMCRFDGTLNRNFVLVPLQSKPVLDWICRTTNGSLAACGSR